MEPIFRKEFEIEAVHTDPFLRLKPASILYFVQETSGAHCELLEADWQTLHQKHLFWAVLRHKVQISRLPVLGEKITVETWPMPTTRAAYPRAAAAYDAQGKELFRCISLWVLMDEDTRSMILPDKSGVLIPGTLRGTELTVPRSLIPRSLKHGQDRFVSYSLLDRNLHMNNTYYMDWVADLLPSAFHQGHPMREFTVCYLSEAREGQQLRLDWELSEDGSLTVDAHRTRTDVPGEKERVFAAQVRF